MKIFKNGILALLLWMITAEQAEAQHKIGIADVSVSITDVKHGMPFMMIAPIHPGFELSTTLLKKDKEKAFHSFSTTAGFYHHAMIANGTYANINYNYQRKIKNTIGLDLHPGLGFMYAVYPGEGYRLNEGSGEIESVTNTSANLAINLGFGLSYIRHKQFQPFLHYDFNIYNLWAYSSFVNSTAILKVGVKINLTKK